MSNQSTKERILEAASREFCDKGFKATTIRDICTRADANVASVNYHFGDKRKLYIQVLSMWMELMMQYPDINDESYQSLSPEDKLKTYVRSELLSLCTYDDPEKTKKRKIRLLFEEYVSEECDPEVFRCHEEIDEKFLYPLIKEILKPIDDQQIISQACMAAGGVLAHHFLTIIHFPEGEIESEEKLEFMTEFYTNFMLGSLKGIREKYNAK